MTTLQIILAIFTIIFFMTSIGLIAIVMGTNSKKHALLCIISMILFVMCMIAGACTDKPFETYDIETKEVPTIDTIVVVKNNVADTTYIYKFKNYE